jgi:leader peptidase (prepilin peptidase)/N-methyltransferase
LLTSGAQVGFPAAPVVAVPTTGALFGLFAWRVESWPEVLAYSCLVFVGVVLAVIDLIEHRIPSVALAVTYPVMLTLFGLATVTQDKGFAMVRATLGMVVMFGAYFALAIAAQGGLGAGDVKLAGVLGLALGWNGWQSLVAGLVLGLAYGAVTGIILIALGKATRRTPMPLGPAMIAGTLTVLIVGGF